MDLTNHISNEYQKLKETGISRYFCDTVTNYFESGEGQNAKEYIEYAPFAGFTIAAFGFGANRPGFGVLGASVGLASTSFIIATRALQQRFYTSEALEEPGLQDNDKDYENVIESRQIRTVQDEAELAY